MKLTNLYNYGCSQVLQIRSNASLKSDPVVSNANSADDDFDELLPPGIYDWAKENSAYLNIIQQLQLNEKSLEELEGAVLQAQTDCSQAIHPHFRTTDIAQAKLTIKLDYILKRIDSYWPEEIDRCWALYKRLFVGQRIEKIALDLGVRINKLKCLLSDFRRLWRLYKNHFRSNNNLKKLTSQHLAFIQQFLI